MATHFRETASVQVVADACDAIAAGLDSDSEAKHLAPIWDSLATKGDSMEKERRSLERAVSRARTKLAVLDALWDPEVAAFGRDIVDRSGGKRDRAPYTRFFKKVTPSAAQTFGIDREVEQGKTWLAEFQRDPNEDLAQKWQPRLSVVTEHLEAGSTARRNALQALAMHDMAEELFIADVNIELDLLEGALIQLFPGQPKRVAAFLEATRPRRKRTRANSDPDDQEE